MGHDGGSERAVDPGELRGGVGGITLYGRGIGRVKIWMAKCIVVCITIQ